MPYVPTRLACAAAVLGMAALAGCGNNVPSGSVAKVGDETITQEDFDKWLKSASQGAAAGGQAAAPDPPEFKKCVAAKREQPQPQGGAQPTAAQLKKQCEQEYDQLKGDVMQFLIQAEWVQQEAEEQDVEVPDQEVRNRLEEEKKRFAQPERRDLNVVLTKNRQRAEQAKGALDGGQSFKQVARRYSIDEASKAQGGKLPDVAEGQQEKAFNDAIFKAKRGQLEGPVKTQFGWYVFEVTRVKPATQQSLEESQETIKNLL